MRSAVRSTPSTDVVDVGEVARVVTVVEHVDRLAGEDVARELEQRHVGAPPRPVHREEAQSRHRQTEEVRVGVRHELVGLLGGGVDAQGMVDVLMHAEGHRGVGAVDRARRREDEMLDAVVAAALQHVQGADDVGVDIGMRVLYPVADPGLSAEMNDPLRAPVGEEPLHAGAVGQDPACGR